MRPYVLARRTHPWGVGCDTNHELHVQRGTGGRCNEELVAFIVVALLVFFIITQPETAADTVKAIGAALVSILESFITFFEALV